MGVIYHEISVSGKSTKKSYYEEDEMLLSARFYSYVNQ